MRNYREEYDKFQSSELQKKKRAKRNKDRNELKKKNVNLKGKDIDHTWSGSTATSKRVTSIKANRGKRGEGNRKKKK